ncbi:SdiA-regulated domain-containing protein [Dyadobacter frigoris]|uniref:SdiA-regulated family protein n=1 Tax=Dyadobacter frigoris TaxID=2576211 RepID=A0A4U6D037_9BACT|nr:SdiA-regulated domain-containing protein [Dyadobacter frigoris]TKT89441.1 SdiA-regulated family protein [Dyadobacter frigoris]
MPNQFRFLLFLTFLSVISFGCNSISKENNLLKEYDLGNPEVFAMPESLKEISGIAFDKGRSDSVYAIQDEEGKLFRLGWQNQKAQHVKFGGKGDFEDLAILKDQVIILKSNGDLYSFPFADVRFETMDKAQEWKNILPKGEYEGLYADPVSEEIFVLCKSCSQDNAEKRVSGYILKMAGGIKKTGNFELDVEKIKALTGKVKKGFKPSALAKNPVTGDWFILSGFNKVLVVTDKNWKPKEVYPLSSNNFNQPEGIAFDKSGNLYISNEGDETLDGNILKIKRLVK